MGNRELEKKRVKMRRAYLKTPRRAYNPTVAMQMFQRRVHGETEFDRYLNMKFPMRENQGPGPRAVAQEQRQKLKDRLSEDGIEIDRLLAHVQFFNTEKYGLWMFFRDDGCSFFLENNRNMWKISCWYRSRERARQIYDALGTQGIRWIDWINVEANKLSSLMD